MHTVILNTGKNVLDTLKNEFTRKRKYSLLYYESNKMLVAFRKLSLSCCKVWTCGSKVSPSDPWVSENHKGHIIVAKSIVSCVLQLLYLNNVNGIVIEIKQLFWSWRALVSRILSPKSPGDTECVLSFAKLFLSS